MLNCDIIERYACVTIVLMCLVAAAAMQAASVQFHQLHKLLQDILLEILWEGLTTMLHPCAFHTGLDRT